MAYCPDYSDSDDSLLADDCDYENFKQRIGQVKNTREYFVNSESQSEKQDLNDLFNALSTGNADIVTKIFDNGLDVNVNLRDDWTPILLAASYGDSKIIGELIKRGANVNSERDGLTALMMACNSNSTLDVIKQLIDAGAKVNAVDRKRMDCCMYAAYSGNLETVKFLLPLAKKYAQDNQQWTALFWAVFGNHIEIVKFLLNEGYDCTLTDVRGDTPVDVAKKYDFLEILELFQQEESDNVLDVESFNISFEEHFKTTVKGEKPVFFYDVSRILSAVKCEQLINDFHSKSTSLYDVLSTSEDDLRSLGIQLPYQRKRILSGIHRFHKHPFLPKSVHVVPLKNSLSNVDVAVHLLSCIKQITAMEACLTYIAKNKSNEELPEGDRKIMLKTLENLQVRIGKYKLLARKLQTKALMWDHSVKSPDFITKHSWKRTFPWKKTLFSVALLAVIGVIKFSK